MWLLIHFRVLPSTLADCRHYLNLRLPLASPFSGGWPTLSVRESAIRRSQSPRPVPPKNGGTRTGHPCRSRPVREFQNLNRSAGAPSSSLRVLQRQGGSFDSLFVLPILGIGDEIILRVGTVRP